MATFTFVPVVYICFYIMLRMSSLVTTTEEVFSCPGAAILECADNLYIDIQYAETCHHKHHDCTDEKDDKKECHHECPTSSTQDMCNGMNRCNVSVSDLVEACGGTVHHHEFVTVTYTCIMLSTTEQLSTVGLEVGRQEITTADGSSFTTKSYSTTDGPKANTRETTTTDVSSSRSTTQNHITTNGEGRPITGRPITGRPITGRLITFPTTKPPVTNPQNPCQSRDNNDVNELNAILAEQNDKYGYQETCSQEYRYRLEVNTSVTLDISGGDYTTRIFLPLSALPNVEDAVVIVSSEVISGSIDHIISAPSNFNELQSSEAIRTAVSVSIDLESNNTNIQIREGSYITLEFGNFENVSKTADAGGIFCVFWDGYSIPSSWSTRGCSVSSTNSSHTLCTCDHLTSFTVLFALEENTDVVTDDNSSILSTVLLSCSLICLVASGCIFIYVGLSKVMVLKIHFSLCVSLASAHLLFLVGIDKTENKSLCDMITLATHYCFTSALMWMVIEGVHLYMASRNCNLTRRTFYAFSAVGWVVPLAIVAASYGIFKGSYRATDTCWLSPDSGSIFIFFTTVALNIMINTVLLGSVMRTFLALRSNKNKHKIERYRASIKAVLLLQPILGLTWIFGFIAGTTQEDFFSYLFIIFNGLQGVFIFLFHCLDNNEVKKKLKLIRDKRKVSVMFSNRNQSTTITAVD